MQVVFCCTEIKQLCQHSLLYSINKNYVLEESSECLLYQSVKNKNFGGLFLPSSSVCFCTYTPGHEVGEAPVILFVEEQVTDPAAERLLIVFVVDDLQHGLRMARPRPGTPRTASTTQ